MSARLVGMLAIVVLTSACGERPTENDLRPPANVEAAQPPLRPAMVSVQKWFVVSTPGRDFSVMQVTKDGALDFEIFEVRKAATPYVRIYLGNAANFPSDLAAGPDRRRTRDFVHPDGATTQEYLLKTTARDWPMQVHVMELRVSGDQDTARDIASHVSAR